MYVRQFCKKHRILLFLVLVFVCSMWNVTYADAEGENVHFGSEGYQWNLDEVSQIGVYAGASGNITSVDMYVLYDAEMLEYTSGGELISPGRVHVSATDIGATEYMEMLEFTPRIAGTTSVTIEEILITNENGETVTPASAGVWVTIPMADGTALSNIYVNGQAVAGFDTSISRYTLDVTAETAQASITLEPADIQAEISDTNLVTGSNEIKITTTNADGNRARYILTINRPEMPAEEVTEETGDDAVEEAEEDTAGQNTEAVVLTDQDSSQGLHFGTIQTIIVIALVVVLIILAVVGYQILQKKKKVRRPKKDTGSKSGKVKVIQNPEDEDKDEEDKDEDDTEINDSVYVDEWSREKELEIAVRHVTMEFKREKDEATSIKELLIRTLKGQRSYEKFKALDDVSFNIWKGEVVGIIGTNGSGKSTLLKIISGALSPTEGTVEVDRKKVQLLTLGTGFDFELTGRENVYLNGSVIGYTKEYIDEKYDEIVRFAELEGFMEEKVRNYSSGMVSRLGFAIATIRNTPEILILDEVLSVGDMFFRKKSEKRIKEMMHDGSTVLIVSHSPSVIRGNCTKAIWIEKGVLRAIGNAADVCSAYEKMNQ